MTVKLSRLLIRFSQHFFIASLIPFNYNPVLSQTVSLTSVPFSCAVSECRMNQSSGTSSSVGVGVTSSFGVNSSAQSTSNYNASGSALLVLNVFDQPAEISTSHNSSLQSVGNSAANNTPVSLTIKSDSIQSKSKDGTDSSIFNSSKYLSEESSGSNADFSASGFSASQDLRFKGGAQTSNDSSAVSSSSGNGSSFAADVIKILDKTGGPEVGTGNASAGSESRTRFQADITTSTFVNAFMSSF